MDQALNALMDLGKFLLNEGLTWGNSGNLSVRKSAEKGYITASGTDLGHLNENDFVEFSIYEEDDVFIRKPSKELAMHKAVFALRPDINAIIHISPLFSTLIACSEADLPSSMFVESMYYLQRTARVTYAHPGSDALAEAVSEKARQTNILFMNNHGVLVYDTSVKEAKMAALVLEQASKMYVLSRCANLPLNLVNQNTVNDFLEKSGYKPKRKW